MEPNTPKHSTPVEVRLARQVATNLPNTFQERTWTELLAVFDDPRPSRIVATELYVGYRPDFTNKIILGVEVTYPNGYATHIVKLGTKKKVSSDAEGWRNCTTGRLVASRIFTPVRGGKLPPASSPDGATEERFFVVYQDAFTLFGFDNEVRRPQPLEDVVRDTVNCDTIDLLSTERAVAHVFTDLGRWFHPGAAPDPARTHAFYNDQLHLHDEDTGERVLELWRDQTKRRELRRAAVWVLAGRDAPDALDGARYLDPVEYVQWAMADESGERLPDTLIGRGHGDLHGQNVLVGVQRGEVEYPAVFDYGGMSEHNVLAWDFAKMETELKVRLLSELADDLATRRWLLIRGKLRTAPDVIIPGPVNVADRLAAFLAFESLLADLTDGLQTVKQVEPIRLAPVPSDVPFKLNRLLAVLLRIRKEAALWLGFRRQRHEKWWDEYGFALAVCGLLNVRWNYDHEQQESALVSAGVALARLPSVRQTISHAQTLPPAPPNPAQPVTVATQPSTLTTSTSTPAPLNPVETAYVPSYRVTLYWAHRYWKDRDYKKGRELVEATVLTVHDAKWDPARRFDVRPEAFHAVPLVAEAALLEAEGGFHDSAVRLLAGLREQAIEYRDFETLGRIGRMFKEDGDRNWEVLPPDAPFQGSIAWDRYKLAQSIYATAFDATRDWYVGINAATLAHLTGNRGDALRLAAEVIAVCDAHRDHDLKNRYWLDATRGEAEALREAWDKAAQAFKAALGGLKVGEFGMADTTYKQLCRLWRFSRNESLGRLLTLFDGREDLRPHLKLEYLGAPPPKAAAGNPAPGMGLDLAQGVADCHDRRG